MGLLIYSLLLLLLYAAWRVLCTFSFYFKDYYLLWNIAAGGRRDGRKVNATTRLHMYVSRTGLLDELSIRELYNFLMTMVDAASVTVQQLRKVLLSYTHAVFCRRRSDGSLRGVMFVGIDRKQQDNGKPYTVINVGLCYFQLNYRGGPYIYSFIAFLFLKEFILHPLTPLYVLGKTYSYKSYLVMIHYLKYSYPRYDHKTPDFLLDIVSDYGLKVKLPNEAYNMDTFVIEREQIRMKKYLTIVDENALKDPHIKFFVDRNPGWIKGHQLITIGLVKCPDVFWLILKTLLKAMRGSKNTQTLRGLYWRPWEIQGSKNTQTIRVECISIRVFG